MKMVQSRPRRWATSGRYPHRTRRLSTSPRRSHANGDDPVDSTRRTRVPDLHQG